MTLSIIVHSPPQDHFPVPTGRRHSIWPGPLCIIPSPPGLLLTSVDYLSMNVIASFSILEVVFCRFIGCSVIAWFLIRIQFQYLVKP